MGHVRKTLVADGRFYCDIESTALPIRSRPVAYFSSTLARVVTTSTLFFPMVSTSVRLDMTERTAATAATINRMVAVQLNAVAAVGSVANEFET